jgi:uncharacterized protein (DUF427 family)
MAQEAVLKAKGLATHSNPLGAVPDGSFSVADNVVVDRNEVIEPRRGNAQYGNSFGVGTDRTKQLINYKDRVLRHVLTNLQWDDGEGFFSNFSGPTVTEVDTGLRIKSIEANGNLYFTTASGIKKISAGSSSDFTVSTIEDSGGVKALDVSATADYSTAGFLEANSKVAYRIVWGITDNNENLILGVPSSRTVLYNVTTSSCIVDLNFAIPSEVTSTSYFYQVYRTGITTGATPTTEAPDPGDEMYLVFEDNVTSPQLVAGEVDVTDITPEDFRRNGTLLYTNPTSGEGISQANEKPPFAKDITNYKGYTFYGNTKTVQRFNLSFLSVTGLTSNTSNIVIQNGVTTNTYLFQGSIETYTVTYTGTIHSDYVNASPGAAKYFTLTSANDERKYLIWYYESVNDEEPTLSGYVNIKVTIAPADTVSDIIDKTITQISTDTDDFNLTKTSLVLTAACANNGYVTVTPTETISNVAFTNVKDGLGTGEDANTNKIFLPRVPTGAENGPTTSQQLEQIAASFVRVINKQDNIVSAFGLSGFNDIPGQILLENKVTTGPAFYLTSNAGSQFTPTLPSSGNSAISTNEVRPNRVYFSKYQQPEAVPLVNYIDVGPKDREIKRIIALRESLFILKEDGIYQLTGESAPFVVNAFDFSSQVLAPDTAVVLNNQIYALSVQGVVLITTSGVQVISRPIENLLLSVTREGFNYKSLSFSVSYETDRSFLLFLPTNTTDVVATQCYRYNTFTSTWTRWNISKTCGIVNFADDKLYLGAGDLNIIEKERKSLTRVDHADRQYDLTVLIGGINATKIKLNTLDHVQVGDVLLQRQYLTGSQYNRILDKLDRDLGVTDTDYLSTLKFLSGQEMRAKLVSLAQKMDLDAGISDNNFEASINNYSYSVTNITAANQSVITIGSHNILVGRYVVFSGTNSVPTLTGPYKVVAISATTITIDKKITTAGNTGTVQTDVSDLRDMQGCYNIIVNKLNNDSGAFFTNYPLSENYSDFEDVVLSINKNEVSVNVKYSQDFIANDITLYKAISSKIIYNPQYFQDPSILKQVSESTAIFENDNFSTMLLSYSSDLSPSFESISFQGAGIGDWGQFSYGSVNWGGVAAPIPLRTFIPRNKQRCRFINVKVEHKVAFEKYSLYGITLKYRPFSTRAYK